MGGRRTRAFDESPPFDARIWGDGWGWALYKPDERGKNVATDYKTDCLGCHIPAKSNDWVYIEAYPTLKTTAAAE